ncbi:MAG: hypothetical protein L0G70_10200 [Rubrobacter sp.]|nr:hypothetical protein [Rubrobacter sp.]
MNVRVPVGTGHQYMQTAHLRNPGVIGEICAEEFARDYPADIFSIRHEVLAAEVKLAAPRLPLHEHRYLEGYRDRLKQIADDHENAPRCAECGEAVLSDQPRYSCSPSDNLWHEGCYRYEPGDDEEPVKFFKGETRQQG